MKQRIVAAATANNNNNDNNRTFKIRSVGLRLRKKQ